MNLLYDNVNNQCVTMLITTLPRNGSIDFYKILYAYLLRLSLSYLNWE